jgi:hypothetical protein
MKKSIILIFILITGLIGLVMLKVSDSESGSGFEAPSASEFKDLNQEEQFSVIEKISETKGHEKAWEFIKTAFATEVALGGKAHDLAHYMGILIFEKRGLDGFGICDPTFAFGCYHGFSESMFSEDLNGIGELEQACGAVGEVGSGPWASCIHGIGHGVATYFDSIEIDKALVACSRLGEAGRTYCNDGVFMEFAISAPPSFYKRENPLYPCDSIAEEYRDACGRNLPQVMEARFGVSETEIVDICLGSADNRVRSNCIEATGLRIGQKSGGNPDFIIFKCNQIKEYDTKVQCVSAAAGEIIFQNFNGWQRSYIEVCNSLVSSARGGCMQRAQQTMKAYNR